MSKLLTRSTCSLVARVVATVRDILGKSEAHVYGLYTLSAHVLLRSRGHLVRFAAERVQTGGIGGALAFYKGDNAQRRSRRHGST